MKRIIAILLIAMFLVTTVMAESGAVAADLPENPEPILVEEENEAEAAVEADDERTDAGGEVTDNVTVKDVVVIIAEMVTGTPEFFVGNNYEAAFEFLESQNITLIFDELNPDDEIIFQEAVAMMVFALGYNPGQEYTLAWGEEDLIYPDGYLAKAEEIGLLKNLEDADFEAVLTKTDFITLVRNFLASEIRDYGPVYDEEARTYRNVVTFTPVSEFFKDGDTSAYMAEIEARFGIEAETEESEEEIARLTAAPTASTVLVNGEETAFDAYLIEGSNYFKLRDLAYVMNGSEKQFNVEWDADNNAIILTSGEEYEEVGGEMDLRVTREVKFPVETSSKIYLDGEEVEFAAYLISGNNYFKLRDVMEALDIYVGWDEETSTITIDTSRGYDESPLVGRWELLSMKEISKWETEELNAEGWIEFSADGSGINFDGGELYEFTWTEEDGQIFITAIDDDEELEFDYSISGSTLTLTRTDEESQIVIVMTFSKSVPAEADDEAEETDEE